MAQEKVIIALRSQFIPEKGLNETHHIDIGDLVF